MGVTEITTTDQFSSILKEQKSILVVYFWADWVPQCQHMNVVFEELEKTTAGKNANIVFSKVSAEQLPEVSKGYSVDSVPTFIFIKNGVVDGRVTGPNAPELNKRVQQYLSNESFNSLSNANGKVEPEDLNARLERMVNSASCILFMKGNREQPKCGFSKQAIEILTQHNCDYETFDILTDEEVRQGLKEYSNWPTYPQLYVKGKLIGGLEMICELDENGGLSGILPKSKNQELNTRLRSLMSNSELVLFIKSTRDQPDCDFTRHLMDIINNTQLSCETLNEDDEISSGPSEPHFDPCKKFINIYRVLQKCDQTGVDLNNVVLFSKRLVDVLTDYVDPINDTYEWSIIELLLLEILRCGVCFTSGEEAPDIVRYAFDVVFQNKSLTSIIAKALSSNKSEFIRLAIAVTLHLQMAEDCKECLKSELEFINHQRFLKCQSTVEGTSPGDFSNITARYENLLSQYKVNMDKVRHDMEVSFADELETLQTQNRDLSQQNFKLHSALEEVLAIEAANSEIYGKIRATGEKAFEDGDKLRAKIKILDPSLRDILDKQKNCEGDD